MKARLLITLLWGTADAIPVTSPASGLTWAVTGLTAYVRAALHPVSPRAAPYDTTANELTDGTACRAVTLIYARGTTQDGNIGAAGDVGPLMMNNLSAILGADQLAVQGVDYDADISGFLQNFFGADDEGAQTMADLVVQATTQCPESKIVLSGYSQGAQVIHDAANILEEDTAAPAQIAAVMIFGDPDNGDPVGTVAPDKVNVICNDGDNICEGGVIPTEAHRTYQIHSQTAAEFVASKVQ
ncbi:unnamed protein product [Discula destructiva]